VLPGEPGDQPGVDGADAQLAAEGPRAVGVDRVEEPLELERGEHRVDGQAADLPDAGGVLGQLRDPRGGAPVLPAEHGPDGLAGGAVPDERRLALRAERHGVDLVRGRDLGDHLPHAVEDLYGVLLHPAGARMGLAERHRGGRDG
jgi:hypothetical protein